MVTVTTLHRENLFLFHVRFLLSNLYPKPIHSLTSLFVVLFNQTFFFFLLPPTYGQTLPRMNCKATSQASFKPPPSDSPFSDLVWLASLQRLMPREHSVCYMFKRARLKCVCPSQRTAWLFLHTPHPICTQLMPLALVSARKISGDAAFPILYSFLRISY